MGLIAPGGTDSAILGKIHKKVSTVLDDAAVVRKLRAQFMVPVAKFARGVPGRAERGTRPLGSDHCGGWDKGGVVSNECMHMQFLPN